MAQISTCSGKKSFLSCARTLFEFSIQTGHSLAQVAQLVERSPEEGDVTSSSLVLSTSLR